MDEQDLQNDIAIAEAVDEHLQEQSGRIEEIQGSLEAIADAVVAEGEPQQLTDHQQEMVDKFKDLSKNEKGEVYAVADKAALEDFLDVTASLARKAVVAFTDAVPGQFKVTAKGLMHYSEMAQRLRGRLIQLRSLLAKREFPYTTVFDYGAYSRFFQVNGQSIATFSEFQGAMDVQNAAMRHVLMASSGYTTVVLEKLLQGLQNVHPSRAPDTDDCITMRDAIAGPWKLTWKEAEITRQPGQTPQVALNEFPERKFVSLAPLLDNRYLVAHEPKDDGGLNPVKITVAVKHYGAAVVFDKRASKPTEHSMNLPNVDDLLVLLDQVVETLGEMRALEALAKKNDSFAKDLKKVSVILEKHLDSSTEPQFYGYVAEYFKLAAAICSTIQQPYVQMAWMYIRCAIVVMSLVELAAVEDSGKRMAVARFFTKQGTEFGNPAMESFQMTQKALQAARRVRAA